MSRGIGVEIAFAAKRASCPLCYSPRLRRSFALRLERAEIAYDRCDECTLFFQNPRLSDETIVGIYASDEYWGKSNSAQSAYSDYERSEPLRHRQSRKRLSRIVSASGIRGGKLLDVGCATGFFGHVAAAAGFEVTGVEPSPEMSRFGRERYGLDIVCSTLEAASIGESVYDVITLWGTDSHFLDPRAGFAKLVRALKPGGVLAMNYQAFDHWIRFFFPGLKRSWNAIFNLTDRAFDRLMTELSMDVVDRGLEWQWVTVDHLFRVTKLPCPPFVGGIPLALPAISFRFVVARKRAE